MDTISSFMLFAGYGAEVALVLALLGVAVLFRSLVAQDRHFREQKDVVASLHAYVAQCVQEQITSHDQIASLKEQCASLHARQNMLEKHGTETQRIDVAMRLLKRGSCDSDTLHDLGLSASEIKLLMRLHSGPQDVQRPVGKLSETAKNSESPQTIGGEAEEATVTVSVQGQALAQVLRASAG